MLLLLALLSAVAHFPAPPPVPVIPDSMLGVVQDMSGHPLPGARVTVVELERSVLTGAGGRFALAVPGGSYHLLVVLAGYRAVTREVTLPSQPVLITLLHQEGVARLAPITVTASRTPMAARMAPMVATDLSGEELQRHAGVSLAQAIDQIPGIRTLSTGAQIGKPMIRGLVGPRVLVLDDGLRLEDYSWSDEDGPSVDARLANRVEVVRGPASLMYGSDAIAGVVNVLPAPLPDAGGGPGFTRLRSEITAASNNAEASALLGLRHAGGRLGTAVTLIGRRAADLHTPAGELDNTGFTALNGEGAIGLHSANGATTLRLTRYGGEFKLLEAGGPGADSGGEGGPERKLADTRAQLRSNYVLGRLRLEGKAQWQHHWISEVSDEAPAPGGGTMEGPVFDLALDTWSSDLLLHHTLGVRVSGTLGLSGLYQKNDTRGPVPLVPDARTAGAGLFLIERLELGRLSLLGGLRGDVRRVSVDGNSDLRLAAQHRSYRTWTADLGAVLDLRHGLSLAANAGRAWRAPDLFELFAYGPELGEARFDIGNRSLRPEYSLNFDLSLRWQTRFAEAEVSAYRNRVADFIYGAPTTQFMDSLRVFQYGQTDATLQGGEARLAVSPRDWLTLAGRAEYVRGTADGTDQPLPLIPPFRSAVGVELHGLNLGWLANGRISGEVETVAHQGRLGGYTIPGQGATVFDIPTDGYSLLNLDVGGTHPVGARTLSLDLEIRNLTNTRYRDYLSRYKEFALNPGRNAVLRVGMEF